MTFQDNPVDSLLANASLEDKYALDAGRVHRSGIQPLVRLPTK